MNQTQSKLRADLPQDMRDIRAEVLDEYQQPHDKPWIVGFSGGKDSTLVLQVVFEAVLRTPPSERRRKVVVTCNDTMVESPIVDRFVNATLDSVRAGAEALKLPIEVVQTRPDPDQTFWVNLLGRGYPAPNRTFRWCTDRMKIRPTSLVIDSIVKEGGEAILLLGARRQESAARAKVVAKYSTKGQRLNKHNDVPGCWVYRPIVELSTDDVWFVLSAARPPWGGSHRGLVALYKTASGGECPYVTSKDDAPSCGSNSARFGCWTCTVVEKDASLEGLIDMGMEELEPLYEFRNRLKEVSGTSKYRSKMRRTGQAGLGPLTYEAREMLLTELLDIQEETELVLISKDEERRVRDWWLRDQSTDAKRSAEATLLQPLN